MLRTACRTEFYPKLMVPVESRESEGVFLLVWRDCDQAYGRYRPPKGAENGHVTIICIWSHVEKFTDSKNAIIFDP